MMVVVPYILLKHSKNNLQAKLKDLGALSQCFLTFLKETPPWAIEEVIIAPRRYLFIYSRHLNPMTPENKIQLQENEMPEKTVTFNDLVTSEF